MTYRLVHALVSRHFLTANVFESDVSAQPIALLSLPSTPPNQSRLWQGQVPVSNTSLPPKRIAEASPEPSHAHVRGTANAPCTSQRPVNTGNPCRHLHLPRSPKWPRVLKRACQASMSQQLNRLSKPGRKFAPSLHRSQVQHLGNASVR